MMKRIGLCLAGMGALMVAFGVSERHACADDRAIFFSPTIAHHGINQVFALDIVSNQIDPYGGGFILRFDQNYVRVLNVAINGGAWTMGEGVIDNDNGTVNISFSQGTGQFLVAPIATVTFQSLGLSGTSTLTLSGTIFFLGPEDSQGYLPSFGTATITVGTIGPTPVPALSFGGLILLGGLLVGCIGLMLSVGAPRSLLLGSTIGRRTSNQLWLPTPPFDRSVGSFRKEISREAAAPGDFHNKVDREVTGYLAHPPNRC